MQELVNLAKVAGLFLAVNDLYNTCQLQTPFLQINDV